MADPTSPGRVDPLEVEDLPIEIRLATIQRALYEGDFNKRIRAMEVFQEIGADEGTFLATLITDHCLNDPDSEVRKAASKALAVLSDEIKLAEMAEKLVTEGLKIQKETLQQSRRFLVRNSLDTLAVLGYELGAPHLDEIKKHLQDTSSAVRFGTVRLYGIYGVIMAEDEDILRTMVNMSRNDLFADVRQICAWALGEILTGAGDGVPEPTDEKDDILYDEEGNPLVDADGNYFTKTKKKKKKGERLESDMPPTELAVRYLMRGLHEDKYASVRRSIATALGQIGGKICAAQAESLFSCALHDTNRETRLAAAGSLAMLGGLFSQQIAEALGMALEGTDDDRPLRQSATEALMQQGGMASPHRGKIADALLDVDDDVRELAALTLATAGPEAAGDAKNRLVNMVIQDDVPWVQMAAVTALKTLGGLIDAADYASQLAAALDNEKFGVRWGAMTAMRALGVEAAAAHQAKVAACLADESWVVRTLACELVQELPPSPAGKTALLQVVGDLDADVRSEALRALGKYGEDADDCVKTIIEVVRDEGVLKVRTSALWVLGQLSLEVVKPFIEDFDLALYHKDPRFRLTAVEALANLGPEMIIKRKDHLDSLSGMDMDEKVKEAAAAALKALEQPDEDVTSPRSSIMGSPSPRGSVMGSPSPRSP